MLQTLIRVKKVLRGVLSQTVARKRKVIKFNWEIHVYYNSWWSSIWGKNKKIDLGSIL